MTEADITRIYTTRFCPFCIRARQLLERKAIKYENISVDGDRAERERLEKATGQHTVPRIFIGDTHIGGYDELAALDASGHLDALLNELGATQGQST